MANDTQLKSAIGTYNTISKLMKKAFVQKRKYCFSQQQQQQSSQLNVIKITLNLFIDHKEAIEIFKFLRRRNL